MTTKYALIIEGSWCGKTHIQGLYNTHFQVISAVWDFVKDCHDNEKVQVRLLTEFIDNDFTFIDGLLTIDEIKVE